MTIEDLSARLERVERANRRMRAGGVVALVLVAAGVAMGQASKPAKLIQAERFEVVDEKGVPRILMAVVPGSQPTLTLGDREGAPRASLRLSPDGSPSLDLCEKDGTLRAMLCASSDDATKLILTDRQGTPRTDLRVSRDGSPGLYLSGQDGDVRAAIGMSGDDSAAVAICERGKPYAVLGVASIDSGATGKPEQTSPSSLVLFGKDGKVIERLPK